LVIRLIWEKNEERGVEILGNFYYMLLAFIAGVGFTTQAGLNGKLSTNLGSPVLTTLVSFIVAAIGLAIAYLLLVCLHAQSVPTMENIQQCRWWMWIGGLFGALLIFTTIFATPKIGFANMFSLVLLGQLLIAVVFDHVGFLGTFHSLTLLRGIGIVLLIVSVYIIQTN
jgi:bacterial/archaeal transporter family-2 protein